MPSSVNEMQNSVWNVHLSSGTSIPILGLGTYKVKGQDGRSVFAEALKIGYRHFDTADLYENLEPLGEAIREAIELNLITRDDVFVTTKVWPTYYGEGRVELAIRRMLQESKLDYFDLVLLHWPFVMFDSDTELYPLDPETGLVRNGVRPLNEVYHELEIVAEKGLSKAIGVSNFNSTQIESLLKVAKIKPATNQVECHLYLAQFELQKQCAKHNIILTAYGPLGSGDSRPGLVKLFKDKTVIQLAEKYRKSWSQIALKWLIQRGIIVIPKTANTEHLAQNLNVFDFELSQADCTLLDQLDRPDGRVYTLDRFGIKQLAGYPF